MRVADIQRMKEGAVLVAPLTMPQLLPAMKKASAILTEVGGVTSHATILSRELKIPCIVGIQNLTATLQDGDFVKVNAEKGIITIHESYNKFHKRI